MDKKKKGTLIIIGFLIVLCGCFLVLSLNARSVLVTTISQSGINTAISHRMMDDVFQEIGTKDVDVLADIQTNIESNQQINKITGKLFDKMLLSVKENKPFEKVDFSNEIDLLISDSLDYIKTKNPEITESTLQKLESKMSLEKSDINQVINDYAISVFSYVTKSNTGNQLMAIYIVLTSKWVLFITIMLLSILLELTFRLSYTIEKMVMCLAIDCIGIFACIVLTNVFGNKVMMLISNRFLGRTMMLDSHTLFINSLTFLTKGILLLMLFVVLRIFAYKQHKKAKVN